MLDGARVHSIQAYLRQIGSSTTIDDYKAQFPGAPILSAGALAVLAARQKANAEAEQSTGTTNVSYVSKANLNEVFGFGNAKAALSSTGKPIPITTFTAPPELTAYVPEIDPAYVFDADLVKTVLLGLELGVPVYLWGHMGVGKSTVIEQICARTGRAWMRVQHARDTESSHITGQWVVRDGATVFELGPLAYAMKHGLLYVADEYDFAMPAILAVYQPVLEGKPLVIKEADVANRIIRPHPNFRMMATGNTNGAGDETGLYQGTIVQNAANYERFGIVAQVQYMPRKMEELVVRQQAGIDAASAEKLVQFANLIRERYSAGEMGLPMSPRSIINAAKIGVRMACYRRGLELSFISRLDSTSRDTAREIMGRVFPPTK